MAAKVALNFKCRIFSWKGGGKEQDLKLSLDGEPLACSSVQITDPVSCVKPVCSLMGFMAHSDSLCGCSHCLYFLLLSLRTLWPVTAWSSTTTLPLIPILQFRDCVRGSFGLEIPLSFLCLINRYTLVNPFRMTVPTSGAMAYADFFLESSGGIWWFTEVPCPDYPVLNPSSAVYKLVNKFPSDSPILCTAGISGGNVAKSSNIINMEGRAPKSGI